jgi:DNA (cytosine-5)-methyltransferase 1
VSGLVVDLFAGGGGASVGLEAGLGRPVDLAVNHDAIAIAVHERSHPRTEHVEADVFDVDPLLAVHGRPVDVLWASPDCTHFSIARGTRPRDKNIRMLASVVTHWAELVRPRVIFVENVPEFEGWGPLGDDGRPDRERAGELFDRWIAEFRAHGYDVEWRVLDASPYGAPTRRRRLFVVARCDGEPIVWPEPTHGPGRLPLRTAAECIDWSIPCPSIFGRKRPLAENTMRRIANGVRRYVIEAEQPFIVRTGHYSNVTGEGRTFRGQPVTEPLGTVCATGNDKAVVEPFVVQIDQAGGGGGVNAADRPLGTVVTKNNRALVAAFLAKHFGGVVGQGLDAPASTITARDHHALASASLAREGEGAGRVAEVRAFLTAYYGSDGPQGQALLEPMRTVTARHRLGLVAVGGVDYQIVDIGMRMLEPHELLAAQFGDHAGSMRWDVTKTGRHGEPRPLSKADRIRLIGNSVPPDVVRALVKANVPAESGASEVAA